MSDFGLHGFSFDTAEARQKAATDHPLWPDFVAWVSKRYSEPFNMTDPLIRELFEAFIEGGFREGFR